MKLHEWKRFARTVRHLRTSQLLWRGRYAFERRLPALHFHFPTATDQQRFTAETLLRADAFPDVPVTHRVCAAGDQLVVQMADGRLHFLNHCESIGRGQCNWQLGPRSAQRLWTITLHYHEWVHGLAEVIHAGSPRAHQAELLLLEYVSDWIDHCDLHVSGARHLAWNSFAIATRIGWWIRSLLLLGPDWLQSHAEFSTRVQTSLWRQAEFLNRHLEWDLRANHLLRDTVGLAWAGRFFTGLAAQCWIEKATRVAVQQVREQILADGAHIERSPMYHLHVMNDVMSLALLLKDTSAREQLRDTWHRMATFAAWMRHPNGQIPLFNDAARHDDCLPTETIRLGRHIGVSVETERRVGGHDFTDAGIAVWHGNPWSVFFDVGDVGPDWQPGHAHADTLSFECSFGGDQLLIDPGTYGYDDDGRRRHDRSTAAHNTVCIDDTDSSEVWHIFRVGARAKPKDVTVEIDSHRMEVTAAHDGYSHLPGSPVHSRQLLVEDGGPLRVVDRVTGNCHHHVSGGFLVAPEWQIRGGEYGWQLQNDTHRLQMTVRSNAAVSLKQVSRVAHPEYGLDVSTHRLEWEYAGELPITVETTIAPQP